jgi:hypothetical protein
MYKQNVVPTIELLKSKLNEMEFDINYSKTTLRLYLRSIGFCYKTLDKRMAIMKTPRLKKHRMEYITQIRQFRQEDREIVYLDVTWYDSHDVVKKGCSDGTSNCVLNTPPSRGKSIIIFQAGK